jgi:hypothetical protein
MAFQCDEALAIGQAERCSAALAIKQAKRNPKKIAIIYLETLPTYCVDAKVSPSRLNAAAIVDLGAGCKLVYFALQFLKESASNLQKRQNQSHRTFTSYLDLPSSTVDMGYT